MKTDLSEEMLKTSTSDLSTENPLNSREVAGNKTTMSPAKMRSRGSVFRSATQRPEDDCVVYDASDAWLQTRKEITLKR
jgi:hypothetical protein